MRSWCWSRACGAPLPEGSMGSSRARDGHATPSDHYVRSALCPRNTAPNCAMNILPTVLIGSANPGRGNRLAAVAGGRNQPVSNLPPEHWECLQPRCSTPQSLLFTGFPPDCLSLNTIKINALSMVASQPLAGSALPQSVVRRYLVLEEESMVGISWAETVALALSGASCKWSVRAQFFSTDRSAFAKLSSYGTQRDINPRGARRWSRICCRSARLCRRKVSDMDVGVVLHSATLGLVWAAEVCKGGC